jgi:hypothetical protein
MILCIFLFNVSENPSAKKKSTNRAFINAIIKKGDISKLNIEIENEHIDAATKEELIFIRLTIFAKYDYKFKSKTLIKYFSQYKWYKPKYEDVWIKMSDLDRMNVTFLLKRETTFGQKRKEKKPSKKALPKKAVTSPTKKVSPIPKTTKLPPDTNLKSPFPATKVLNKWIKKGKAAKINDYLIGKKYLITTPNTTGLLIYFQNKNTYIVYECGYNCDILGVPEYENYKIYKDKETGVVKITMNGKHEDGKYFKFRGYETYQTISNNMASYLKRINISKIYLGHNMVISSSDLDDITSDNDYKKCKDCQIYKFYFDKRNFSRYYKNGGRYPKR